MIAEVASEHDNPKPFRFQDKTILKKKIRQNFEVLVVGENFTIFNNVVHMVSSYQGNPRACKIAAFFVF